jgi:carbamoyl-phosphate synthase large subunit
MTDGHVHAVVTMRRDLKDGNTYRAYVVPDSPFDPFLADVARRLRGHGPLNFQFRVAGGVPKIFEINARFSGTTPMRAHAGFNEVDRLLRHVLLGEPVPHASLREIVVLRYWDELVVRPEELQAVSAGDPGARLGSRHSCGAAWKRGVADAEILVRGYPRSR